MKNLLKIDLRKTCLFVLPSISLILNSACGSVDIQPKPVEASLTNTAVKTEVLPDAEVKTSTENNVVINDAAGILDLPEVPILCYHQIRDFQSSDSKTARDYIVPVANFREQMKLLADSGYHAVVPDQLYDYLTKGTPLPSKPVMITFDDTRVDQYTVALPELNKHGFKGVFFIMTVSLNRPGYMSPAQVKQLSDEGHTIGSHTWNHGNVKTYAEKDWITQVEKPSKQLQGITGKKVDYFAYPFGLWNKEAIAELKKRDFKAVFQLTAHRDQNDPLFSIRRMIVPGNWSAATMQKVMRRSF